MRLSTSNDMGEKRKVNGEISFDDTRDRISRARAREREAVLIYDINEGIHDGNHALVLDD